MDGKLWVGIDLVETERMRRSVCKNASFLVRFFREEERERFGICHYMGRITHTGKEDAPC